MTVAELRALLAAATPGPWEIDKDSILAPRVMYGEGILVVGKAWYPKTDVGRANGDLIAAAVNELPGLLDRLDAQDDELRRWRAASDVDSVEMFERVRSQQRLIEGLLPPPAIVLELKRLRELEAAVLAYERARHDRRGHGGSPMEAVEEWLGTAIAACRAAQAAPEGGGA